MAVVVVCVLFVCHGVGHLVGRCVSELERGTDEIGVSMDRRFDERVSHRCSDQAMERGPLDLHELRRVDRRYL